MKKYQIVYADPPQNVLRQTLKEGVCWWCKRVGFKSVANHTSKAHGITAREIRDLANLTKSDSIATPEYSEFCKTRPQTLHCEKLLASEKRHDAPLDFTNEGLRRKRENVKDAQEALGVMRSSGFITHKGGSPEQLQKARSVHLAHLRDGPIYYTNWRKALSSTGRDKRIIAYCPICGKPFKKYETSNRKTCGNPKCTHILRSNITRELNYLRQKVVK